MGTRVDGFCRRYAIVVVVVSVIGMSFERGDTEVRSVGSADRQAWGQRGA